MSDDDKGTKTARISRIDAPAESVLQVESAKFLPKPIAPNFARREASEASGISSRK